ncbi:3-deoxy-D-manno-octulosonic acid transferase [Vibrio stylophorae]|uniref:3-deoxy-D-manno-octulosonic acid transferase n=1 Tax=Vibrio stylophorae TaxID=659351 RepID=A0ABN8DUG7_9VIBR|nr:lipid IV(A) 3-deoxy-D-manno-octulosonic acid transferase [Vibrio stylophorae]CAH0534669.1 3-deoxy-D-manno-octulosonic acid transferase [Vibrio stylophorae]
MIRFLYTLLLSLISPILLFGLYRKRPNKPAIGPRWVEHFGNVKACTENHQKPIWLHTVSVGEAIAAKPLMIELLKQYPTRHLLVTTTTTTGAAEIAKIQQQLQKQSEDQAQRLHHRYAPLDFPFAVKRFLSRINPSSLLIMETELWPNLLTLTAKKEIPITILNARLSEKSCRNYGKIKPLFKLIAKQISQILCQSQADADRFARLGVATEKLHVTGSIKFDIQISDETKAAGKALRQQLGLTRPIWIAASTHKGEDEQVLEAHRQVLEAHPNALLILVPRHPERFDDVFTLCQQQNFHIIRRTGSETVNEQTQVYLGDTMGEMLTLIGAADVCFMGGSLLGDKVGGHNVLEPAALGVPVITGPSYFNFQFIIDEMKKNNRITLINNDSDLSAAISEIVNNKKQNIVKADFTRFTHTKISSVSISIKHLVNYL